MNDILNNFIKKKSSKALEYSDIIEDMLGQYHNYGYAEQTLINILDYIEKNNHITEGQIMAVDNIKNKPAKNYGGRY